MKTVGILGGMGPGASSVLYQKIIEYCQDKLGATQDTDYPPVILYSLPLYGFDETGITNKRLVKRQLIHGVKTLEHSGADFIVIACNTVHYFIEEMRANVSIPIISIIEESLLVTQKHKYRKVGLLSSKTTKDLGIYEKIFAKGEVGMLHVNEKQQKVLNNIIESVMGGNQGAKEVDALKDIIQSLAQQGAETVILGCTELPLAIKQKDVNVPLIDTLQLLAELSVNHAILPSKANG